MILQFQCCWECTVTTFLYENARPLRLIGPNYFINYPAYADVNILSVEYKRLLRPSFCNSKSETRFRIPEVLGCILGSFQRLHNERAESFWSVSQASESSDARKITRFALFGSQRPPEFQSLSNDTYYNAVEDFQAPTVGPGFVNEVIESIWKSPSISHLISLMDRCRCE